MNTLRNVSGQSFLIQKAGGGTVHLFPGRAVALTAEECKSSQIRNLITGGLARVTTIGHTRRGAKAAQGETARHDTEKREAPERRPDKKKGES